MNKFRENESGLAFMSWEQNPNKRNNSIVKFNINKDIDIVVGDVLQGDRLEGKTSEYTITEVIDTRPSSIKGKNYVTVRANWTLN